LTTTDSRLVVAGGGGGGAVGDACGGAGGTGGDATKAGAGNGGSGSIGCPPASSTAGSNAGLGGPRGSGAPNFDYPGGDGGNGSLGQGGYGGGPQGGGGGGGYYGGGGGGAGETGGGGGAGSSYFISSAINTSISEDTSGTPEVQITPVFPSCRGGLTLTNTVDPSSATSGAPGQSGIWTFDVRAQNCTGGTLNNVKMQGGTAGWLSFFAAGTDPSSGTVARLTNNRATVFAASVTSLPDQATATVKVTVSGIVPKGAICGAQIPISGSWSASALNATHKTVNSQVAARATITVICT
jgi:hypothetical protein